ncbi:MAG: Stf0 family sulfotransferase [Pseudomonadota bacterium]
MKLFDRFIPWRTRGDRHWSRDALLRLFAEYLGDERIEELADKLAPIGDRPLELPPRFLAIVFASRSGSTYVSRLLSNTDWFVDFNESLNPEQLVAIRQRYDFADNRQSVQWMLDNRGTQEAFGYKFGFFGMVTAAHLGFLTETLPQTQFIRLVRRDRVAQAISLLRAKLSGRLHSIHPEGKTVSLEDYDAEKIAANVKHVARNEKWFGEILDRLGKPAPIFVYEDICADPEGFVAEICALLDLPAPEVFEAEVDLEILRDEISDAWAARFRDERPDIF